jgi:hypothetical protein
MGTLSEGFERFVAAPLLPGREVGNLPRQIHRDSSNYRSKFSLIRRSDSSTTRLVCRGSSSSSFSMSSGRLSGWTVRDFVARITLDLARFQTSHPPFPLFPLKRVFDHPVGQNGRKHIFFTVRGSRLSALGCPSLETATNEPASVVEAQRVGPAPMRSMAKKPQSGIGYAATRLAGMEMLCRVSYIAQT